MSFILENHLQILSVNQGVRTILALSSGTPLHQGAKRGQNKSYREASQ
jgi:hypothetical protein